MLKQTYRLIMLAVVFVGLLTAAACGGGNDKATDDTKAPAATPEPTAVPKKGEIILSTTTSTQDSGLLDVLLPLFEKRSGWTAKPIAVGSGQALEMGRRGDADVLLVHSPDAEVQFMSQGFGKQRILIMHNDFIIVGPANDPAGIKSAKTANDAMKAIADKKATFISRGDASGTNALELTLWKAAGIEPKGQSWYQESGQGMGATLQITDQKAGYTISDRATYVATKANLKLAIVNEGDKAYFNVYHVITLDPAKNPKINVAGGQAFADFMVAPETQAVIKTYGLEKYGQALFIPDVGKTEAELGVR